ncbi:uncharacterized protein LOC116194710 isoform X2 [Punica granatum]|uniref:Uncharacterized protein LOC116194710 isoform X2 n=1 Tax=Punica granatum TaxID=22663 RepID=A0A6P8C993_PUNGR|nr:uncharacterized protein LOC116194710 isoform X2 [Punica granatum]
MENRKKRSITEEDISILLQRYPATTLLALLQEVAQFEQVRINWHELVKRSSTGISSPREYQMLWRHLAYRDALFEKSDDGVEPLVSCTMPCSSDDDSDLEYELEALPAVSGEASAEVAASVKVLISSGLTSDGTLPKKSSVEAPLTINIPNGQPFRASSEGSRPTCLVQGMKNTANPVSIEKSSLPPSVTGNEGSDPNGNMLSKKKRKQWSEAEDLELIAAVRKCGEGNWANILKANFKGDRTAAQLSQRWAIIRKRQGNSNLSVSNLTTASQLSEAQLATRHAVSVALDMHVKPLRTGTFSSSTLGQQAQNQTRQVPEPRKLTLLVSPSVPPLNSSASSVKTSPKENNINNSHDDMVIKAAAVAAGARIATPSDAASLIKAAQSKNAVHIIPRGSSLKAASVTGVATTKSAHQTSPPAQSGHAASTSATSHNIPGKDARPTVQNSPSDAAISPQEQDIESEGGKVATELSNMLQEPVPGEDVARALGNEGGTQMQEDAVLHCVNADLPANQNSDALTNREVLTTVSVGGASEGDQPAEGEKAGQAVSEEKCEKESLKGEALDSR